MAEPGTEELGLMSPPAVKTWPSNGGACLESLRLLEASPASTPPTPTDLPELRGTTEHTNNRIGESAWLGVLGCSGSGRGGPCGLKGSQRPWDGRPCKEEAWVPAPALICRRCFLRRS